MCNEIYVPSDAFSVENENSTLLDAQISKATIERYNKYYNTLLEQGYTKDQAKQKADQKLEQFFEIYMARYQKNSDAKDKIN